MKYYFKRNTRNIEEINREYVTGKLLADPTYQRRKVWNDQDKVRLIETILIDFIIPEVFFWTAQRDPETGVALTHIVDGQQRISTIVEFIAGEFSLNEKYLMNDIIKEECANIYFSDLNEGYKNKIWEYPVSVVEIDTACTLDEIKKMFYRLNLTNYNLNQQEMRNSKDSAFGDKCEALSTYEFWEKVRVFSSADAKRMRDVEYCCGIYILANEGIIDQTNGKRINEYYDDYKEAFDEDGDLQNKILKAIDMIESYVDKSTISFISKKAQLYTLFCMTLKMLENKEENTEKVFERLKTFINAYVKFRNEFDISYNDEKLAALLSDIKKYKLASSEGINKVTNRMIRFEILYRICVIEDDNIIEELKQLECDFNNKVKYMEKDVLEQEDLVDVEG